MLVELVILVYFWFFFFQAEDGIRDKLVTGVQTCALPICAGSAALSARRGERPSRRPSAVPGEPRGPGTAGAQRGHAGLYASAAGAAGPVRPQIGRASCRERV